MGELVDPAGGGPMQGPIVLRMIDEDVFEAYTASIDEAQEIANQAAKMDRRMR